MEEVIAYYKIEMEKKQKAMERIVLLSFEVRRL